MPFDPVAFPLLPLLPDGSCSCGDPGCSRAGKHPAVAWKELKKGDFVPARREGAGVGLKTGAAPKGSGVFVVDLDGSHSLDEWEKLGGTDWVTREVVTPRGRHLYFQHPGFWVRNSAGELAPGIDIRGDGGFVVAPGSPHRSGSTYRLVADCEPTKAPGWLLEWLLARGAPSAPQEYPGDVLEASERSYRRDIYARYLASEAPARGPDRRGQGDTTLFQVVQYGAYDLALPTEDVLELVREHYDPRCSPMWGDELEERVTHKAHCAKTQSTRPRKTPLLQSEEALLIERTAYEKPQSTDPDCGFNIRWGGWDRKPLPLAYLVENLLIESKVSMIFAEPGSIKSWSAIDLARCIAAGLPWLGERSVRKGPVLFIDFEDGEHEFHRRVHLLAGGQDVPDLGYLYSPGRIDEDAFWKRLAALQKARGISFFIIDTLAGGTPGADENDKNAAAGLEKAGNFTEVTKATVLFLHHANRAGEIRGTSAFKANVDTLFKLETTKDEDGVHQARLTCTKSGQRKVYPIHLELTDDGLTKFEPQEKPEEGVETDKRTLDELENDVRMMIHAMGPIGSYEKIRALVKAGTARVRTAVKELEAKGDIIKMKDGWVSDSEEARLRRLGDNVKAHDDWSRGKLIAQSFVSGTFFDECLRTGRMSRRVVGNEVDGFIWHTD